MQALSMHETQHLRVTEPAWLTALGGTLWVTRRGDVADYVLAPGERLALARGDDVTVGGWDRAHPALWDWQLVAPRQRTPRQRYRLARALVAGAFGLAARALRGAAAGLSALARNAASIACRAQGCMSRGDSIASAGTVQ
jgi:Protein of unknown function (DUF2917)